MRAPRTVPLLLVLSACSESAVSALMVSPLDLDFGQAEVDTSRAVFLHLENSGDDPLELLSFELESPSGEITIPEPGPAALGAKEARHLRVVVSPKTQGELSATFTVEANDGQGPKVVLIHGSAVTLGLEVLPPSRTCAGNPNSLSFGAVRAGDRAASSIAIRSTGTGAIGVTPRAPEPFELQGPDGYSLDPGETVEISIELLATRAGDEAGVLILDTTSDVVGDLEVELCAQSLAKASCVPPRVDLGKVDPGTSTSTVFEVVSCGNEGLRLSDVSLSMSQIQLNTPGFTVQPLVSLPADLPPGSTLPVEVTYLASNPDGARAYVAVTTDAEPVPQIVEAVANARDCTLTMDPPIASFHRSIDERQSITITNEGTDDCVVRAAYVVAPTYFGIVRMPRLPMTLRRRGGSFTMEFLYYPLPGQPALARLTIEMEGQAPVGFELRGDGTLPSGCRLAATPPRLDFGLSSGSGPATTQLTLSNRGSENCQLSSPRMSSGSDSRFSVMMTGPLTIQPNASATTTVMFTPSAANRAPGSGVVQVTSNDRVRPQIDVPVRSTSTECPSPCTCPPGESRAYWRFDPPGTPSSAEAVLSNASAFKLSCEVTPCANGQVRVETARGRLECLPVPPPCPSGRTPELRPSENSYAWVCTLCNVVVHFGGLYDNVRVCAPEPQLTCPTDEVPTFDAETYEWQCIATCDNGAYDQRMLDGTLICVPC
ncbi:MAG: choice-of-anchor D domain-containing protein [Deltaproteobacteria bacterium]|nr:choice-of-anchor D domain-containing protein [Deltaproteobacteria bacterium]